MATTLSGKLKATHASGAMQLDVSIVDKQTNTETVACHSGAVRWWCGSTRSAGR